MPNIGFIVGTPNYFDYVTKNIFEKYIDNKKCIKDKFSQRPELIGEEYDFYYCEESLYDTMKSLYKPVLFKQASLSEIFELNFNDVFIKHNGYLIFKIIFSIHEHKDWDLGTPFMKKYQFDFDFPNKKIGYYKISNGQLSNDNSAIKKFIYVGIAMGALILGTVLIVVGIYIGKYYFKLRKKRANELDDEFDYNQKKDDTNPNPIINESE